MTTYVEGTEELQANMARLAERYGKEIAKAAQKGGQLVRTAAVKSIHSTSKGEKVTRYRNGGGSYTHTASAPMEAPNTDTGRLVNSVQVETTGDDVFVGSTVEYAGYLEFGTTRMSARPWLNPALESERRNILRLLEEAADPEGKV